MQLLNWSQYTLTNTRSWPALGLIADLNNTQQALGSYTHEGHSLTLLRNAIQQWNVHHAFQAHHILAVLHRNGYPPATAELQVSCCITAFCIPNALVMPV